jgi:PAS domain S-box-containing protein
VPNHVYELANNLYLQLIDKKSIIGKTVKEVLPELEAQGIFEFLDTVYKTGETFSANEMLVKFDFHGNGKLVDTYLNFIYQAHRDIDGTIDGIFFFANDVTEQVLSRKKIEESVLRYSSLIEQASDAICIINGSMKIIEVNRYACEKLGYSRAEIFQLSIGDFFLEEHLKANPLKIDALKGGNTVRGERRIKRKDGTLMDVELSVKILKDGSMLLFARDITENKKAQQALVESEKKYRQIVETAQEGIWLIDENHKTTFVNDKMCQILEYTQKEMMGKDIYSFMDEEGKQIATKLMKRKKKEKSEKGYFKYIAKSGKEIWTNVAANPFISETGDYKGSMAMVTDITEIKKAQQTLKENEKKYRSLFDNNPMPMWVIDLITFKFLDVNKMAILQYGYSQEEFLSMTALDIRPDKDKDHFTKSWDRSEINATNFNKGVWNHQKKNGTIIQVEIIAHEIIYEGSPARFILSNDITDRKKSEEALWNSEEKFRNLINFSPVGITLSSKQGEILETNQTIIDIMGFEYKEEFINIPASELYVNKNDRKQLIELFKKDGVVKNFEAQLKRKNGELIWVSSHIHPFKLPDGEMVMLSTTFDITDRKKAELKLERQNKKLAFQNEEIEDRAAELIIANKELAFQNEEKANRAAELMIANKELAFQNEEKANRATELIIANKELAFQNEEKENRAAELIIANKELAFQNEEKENRADELIIANKELVKTNTELDRFVYSVSHDLRSPLTSVLGLLSFIEGESQEPDTLEHAKMIRNSINRLDEFIKNILSYSRNNRTGLEVEKISIQETVLAIVASLQCMKEAKGILYEIDIKEQQSFYTDRLRFNTILENLISNAIKYHKKEESGRYIKILGHSDHEKLQLIISDNGIGIAPAHHQKIFDMFFRLSGKKDGSGIGLYIVKDTVEILQGSIKTQSEKGTGTTFIITLKNLKP